MADDGQLIRGINWRQAFPFVNIFRSFRVAIHPSKLVLGLALLLSVYFGGRVLDAIWPIHDRAIPGEIDQYQLISIGKEQGTLRAWRDKQQQEIDDRYAEDLVRYKVDSVPANPLDSTAFDKAKAQATKDAKARNSIHQVVDNIYVELDKSVKDASEEYSKAPKAGTAHDDAEAKYNETIRNLYDNAAIEAARINSYKGIGLFAAFFEYEINQTNNIVEAVRRSDWVSRGGVLECTFNFLTVGPTWLIFHHSVFAIFFGILFLFAWSLFGGAIARIAAVHVARDEKISVRQAMNFAVGKFLSFASAPVIPILIVAAIGLVLTAASILGNIPGIGPLIIGVFFFLALLGGFVMTLVLLGTAGGFNLMYATIAVEGSDSFDAISRSFSYVYARPWRMLFYTAVAVTYGAATYLFVHMFIWMMLMLTHQFVGMGMFTTANNTRDLLSTMWPSPTSVGRLTYSIDHRPLNFFQGTGAYFIQIWVMLLVSFLGAFAISLYFSANTIIYYLMRGEVDATELDDVYMEQSDEDFGETAPIPTPAAGTTASAPAESTPPGNPTNA